MTTYHADVLRQFLDGRRTARALVLKGANLRGVQLAGLRADGLDLEEADLRDSTLARVRWKGCILRDARFDGADLTGAVLRLCDLDQARAPGATLVDARVENSTARGGRFDGADLQDAVLEDTDFSRASLRGARLDGVSATGADFRGADLREAWLRNAVLVDCDLRGADLHGADLQGADLRGADLRGVVGVDPAAVREPSPWDELPPEMRDLAETMTPVVLEALRTAGRRGALEPAVTQRLIEQATALGHGASPRSAPSADTLRAVSQVLDELGDDVLPALLGALQQPGDREPPPEVKAMILRLQEAFALDRPATADDVFERLIAGIGRPPRAP